MPQGQASKAAGRRCRGARLAPGTGYSLHLAAGAGEHGVGAARAGGAGRRVAGRAAHVRAARLHAAAGAAALPVRGRAGLPRAENAALGAGGAEAYWNWNYMCFILASSTQKSSE